MAGREIDIAAVAALLIYQQKVTIKYGGVTIQPDNSRLPDMLRARRVKSARLAFPSGKSCLFQYEGSQEHPA